MKTSVFLSILISLSICEFGQASVDPLIRLPGGYIRGKTSQTLEGKPYYTFAKIPFASPPVGNLRFKPPIPPKPWTGVLNTTVLDIVCYQVQYNVPYESEDCLYLNVHTPHLPQENRTLLPVMFFIFGGSFTSGFPDSLLPGRLIQEDVILVAVNYRLGPFGFLSTQDRVIPGNNGLKDQQLGLQWTYRNIRLFGGDPKQITIWGVSAGSASVSYQLLNRRNARLIKSAIMISGTALNPWAYKGNSRQIAFGTAAVLNSTFATSNDSLALRDFLLNANASDIDRASQRFGYGPVIEPQHCGAFLTEKMYSLVKHGRFIKVPVLVGMTADEMLYFFQDNHTLSQLLASYDANPTAVVPPGMMITDPQILNTMAQNIKNLYTNGSDWAANLGIGLGYSSDNNFARAITRFVELVSRSANTFFYMFSYSGPTTAKQFYYPGAEKASHADEQFLLDSTDPNATAGDKLTIQRLATLYTNFAKFQNPSPQPVPLFDNLTWPLVNTTNGDILYVNINNTLEVRNRPRNVTYTRWVQLYDSLGYDDFVNY